MIRFLHKEAVDGTCLWPVGRHLRQLRIGTLGYKDQYQDVAVDGLNELDLSRGASQHKVLELVERLIDDNIRNLYWPTVFFIIPTLRHLRSLTMSDCNFNNEFFDFLSKSSELPIENLILSGRLPENTNIRTGREMPSVKTLSIEVCHDTISDDRINSSGFCRVFFESCRSSLRRLELNRPRTRVEWHGLQGLPVSPEVEFDRLGALHIHRGTAVDTHELSCLIQEGLSSLVIPYDDSIALFLSRVGQIRSLDTMVLYIEQLEDWDWTPHRFIESNTQISSLAICGSEEHESLRRMLWTLRNHTNLKTLLLMWKEPDIPRESLIALSYLSSIEVLSIGAGEKGSPLTEWVINYDRMRLYLSHLVNLRRLIFLHNEQSDSNEFYGCNPSGDSLRPLHEATMMRHASTYIERLPKLEFIFLRGIPINVTNIDGVRKPVVAWTTKFPTLKKYDVLGEEFGIHSDFIGNDKF
ncbi:hypothetical protein GGR51DRAFT_538447 [Nemania sp. FL0031]|nr:hypothetical protein GGR51DRAFT_538447 [Nemania sp. FL0031]